MKRIKGRAWVAVLWVDRQEQLVCGAQTGPNLYRTKAEAQAVLRWTRRMYKADAGKVRRFRYTIEEES